MGHVWLIGMMGSGKSTVGRLVADRLGRPFYDTDELVAQLGESSISEIFAEEGESGFREREKRIAEEVASSPSGIVATGGGIVLDTANVATMQRSGTIVYLSVDVEMLSRRLGDGDDRPLLAVDKGERLRTIASERNERYQSSADVIVDATDSVEAVVADVEAVCSES
jgi:shikimate kinase